MGTMNLDKILVTPLKCIPTSGGEVMHALKKKDHCFKGFGEAYFSWIDYKAIKAWKCHQRMTLNLIVPLGMVRFVFYLSEQKNNSRVEDIGEERYARLTIPPGFWFGFQGIASGRSLLMNVADIEHDPDEVLRKPVSNFLYDWNSG